LTHSRGERGADNTRGGSNGDSGLRKYVTVKNVAIGSAAVLAVPLVANAASTTILTATLTSTSIYLESLKSTGFYQSFSLIFLSEIGDKTFFIAGLLAASCGRLVSFVGSLSALSVMTVISVLLGQIFHAVPSSLTSGLPLDDYAAILAFTFFGYKTLREALDADDDGGNSGMDEELADAKSAVGASTTTAEATKWAQVVSTFGLVFAAEFGDRSFLATIALAAAQNPISVGVGAIAGHAIATVIAVAGGSYIAKYLSEKVIGIIGGTLFLVFAFTTALGLF